jgi:hypothetical protein
MLLLGVLSGVVKTLKFEDCGYLAVTTLLFIARNSFMLSKELIYGLLSKLRK